MSRIEVARRLSGSLPSTEDLTQRLGQLPTQALRRGDRVSKRRTQPVDLWLLGLGQWDSDWPMTAINAELVAMADRLAAMSGALAELDRQCQADLYVSMICDADRAGFGLPALLVGAAAAAKLSIQCSMLVMYDADESDSEVSRSVPQVVPVSV
jgi:Domain of unknown function (DUF4279)